MKEDLLMTLNKAEAIHTLAVHMGISDGDFSKDEISRLEHNPKFEQKKNPAKESAFQNIYQSTIITYNLRHKDFQYDT
jgi:hypothetical protein